MPNKTVTVIFSIIVLFVILWAIVTGNGTKGIVHTPPVSIQRIVSLSPSITSMIIDLGCEHLLVGVTQYHPPLRKPIAIVGTITNPNVEQIVALSPHVVFASHEDGATQKIEQIAALLYTYTLPAANDFEAICNNYLNIARLLKKYDYAQIKLQHYRKLRARYCKPVTAQALILLCDNPYIAASEHTFISNLFFDAGFANVVHHTWRYPLVQLEYILFAPCNYIITLSDTTLPQRVKHTKAIITINYENIYLYTPYHYCDALQHIVSHIHI